jgi:shikimate dehydrogenase
MSEREPLKDIYGVLGHPIRHTLSPPMHNCAFRELNIPAEYAAFDVSPENLGAAFDGMRALGIRGFNCTIPLKELVHQYVDEVHPDAQTIGAVNTIHNQNGRLTGYNTDIVGFIKTLGGREQRWQNATVVLFGAGGTARAILFALQKYTPAQKVVIVNRTSARAESLAEQGREWGAAKVEVLTPEPWDVVANTIRNAVAVVNTTSLGMSPDIETSPIVDDQCLHDNLIAVDMVYNPLRTRFLQQAHNKGAATVGGLDMLVHQGAASFNIWTGRDMPIEHVRLRLLDCL